MPPVQLDAGDLTAIVAFVRSIRRQAITSGSFRLTDVTDSGILTTGSDLLVTGGREGYFQALDARTGSLLWKANLGGQIVSGPMSYQVAGKIVRRTI
jgi:outer membrane protein assembly factor BamB